MCWNQVIIDQSLILIVFAYWIDYNSNDSDFGSTAEANAAFSAAIGPKIIFTNLANQAIRRAWFPLTH